MSLQFNFPHKQPTSLPTHHVIDMSDDEAMDDIESSCFSYDNQSPPLSSFASPTADDDLPFVLLRSYSDPIRARPDPPPRRPEPPIRSVTLPTNSLILPSRLEFFAATDSVLSQKKRYHFHLHQITVRKRRQNINGVLVGNNKHGRKGKPRCEQCRAWRQKVRTSH
jgi:hypothetical protein